MLKYITDYNSKVVFDIYNFNFSGAAENVYDRCVEKDRVDDLKDLIEVAFIGETPTEDDINNFVTLDAEDYLFGDEYF